MKSLAKKAIWIIGLLVLLANFTDNISILPAMQAQEVHDEQDKANNNKHNDASKTDSHKDHSDDKAHEGDHDENHASHGDEIAPVYILVFALILGAVIGRFVAKKLNQPAVLGELMIGLVFGAILYQYNAPTMLIMRHNDQVEKIINHTVTDNLDIGEAVKKVIAEKDLQKGEYGDALRRILKREDFNKHLQMVFALKLFSALGVLLLLFMVGLECNFQEMLEVGGSSFSAAIVGIVVPFVLGFYTTKMLIPELSNNICIFVGATLCATSIGITARVFKDMNKLHIPEAKVVMGAAVIDDILGLIILAVVTGIAATGLLDLHSVSLIIGKAFLFLVFAIFVVGKLLRRYTYQIIILDRSNAKLLFSLSLLMVFAWASDRMGLASIVGAFAAGLILENNFFSKVKNDKYESIESAIGPIESLFAPIFFVMMGMLVDVTTLIDTEVIKISLVLTAVAIVGKMVAGWAISKKLNSLVVGIGLVPRGEVGLIFASIGKTAGILDKGMFSAVIVVVMLTTFFTPIALKWSLEKMPKDEPNDDEKNQKIKEVNVLEEKTVALSFDKEEMKKEVNESQVKKSSVDKPKKQKKKKKKKRKK